MQHNKIKILDPIHAQQIAAGEVIERPANIVKELLENALDAGSSVLTIRIEKAGKQLISITDNGCGMSHADALLCFARHATSKLSTIDDLMHVQTFGFRGEALASIASVAQVTLTTKEHTEHGLGTRIMYAQGVHHTTERIACPQGTTITIEHLFATLPVRKTFLKQDETEWNQIQSIVYGIALTHPALHLTLIKDGNTLLTASSVTSLKERITQLWGHALSTNLTPVSAHERGITITGLTSLPPYARYGKDLIMFWVNNRLVKNTDITRAITKGYLHSLTAGKYPATFLSITLDHTQVDINIHPRKEEVRFTHAGILATCIQQAITQALESALSSRLTPVQAVHAAPLYTHISAPTYTNTPPQHAGDLEDISRSAPHPQPLSITSLKPSAQTVPMPTRENMQQITPPPFRIIGQLFATYILIELHDELILIDQHAAHERILYHQYTTTFTGKEGTHLLFPETVVLPSEFALTKLLEAQSFFADQGIEFAQSGPHHLTISSCPPQLQKDSLSSVLLDAADFMSTHHTLDTTLFRQKLNEHVHSHLACKMAVKAGDALDTEAMEQLITKLLATPNKFMCVHGRPTMWPVSKYDVEKRFKRRN
jgi:DNA mismatch repair protein MutL